MLPSRDCSVLSPMALKLIKRRSKPAKPDYAAMAEQERRQNLHVTTRQCVSGWNNTIAKNRMERQTRLQREAEVEEQRKRVIDDEEKKVQKLKRQAAVAEARKAEFMQRTEVRGVNAQLKLQETRQENEYIQVFKERKKIEEMRRQVAFDDEQKRVHDVMLAKEEKVRRERREKAIATAEEFKRQRELKEEEASRIKEELIQDQLLLTKQMKLELKQEQEAKAARLRMTKQHQMETRRQNETLLVFKERAEDVEAEEDLRIMRLAEKTMDEQDARRAYEEKRKRDRLAARQKVIDVEARRQMAQKKVQQDFLDKQLREQHEKETKNLAVLTARRRQIDDERRRDYLETTAIQEAKKKEKMIRKGKRRFPVAGEDEQDRIARQHDIEHHRVDLDIQEFNIRLVREKKEREAAVIEREKLEFQQQQDEQDEALRRAQEYAVALLARAQEEDDAFHY